MTKEITVNGVKLVSILANNCNGCYAQFSSDKCKTIHTLGGCINIIWVSEKQKKTESKYTIDEVVSSIISVCEFDDDVIEHITGCKSLIEQEIINQRDPEYKIYLELSKKFNK